MNENPYQSPASADCKDSYNRGYLDGFSDAGRKFRRQEDVRAGAIAGSIAFLSVGFTFLAASLYRLVLQYF